MIQRIQSLYFLLAIVILVGFLFVPIVHIVDTVSGLKASLSVFYIDPVTNAFSIRSAWGNDSDFFSDALSYILLGEVFSTTFLLIFAILMFKDRAKQLLFSKVVMLLLSVLSVLSLVYLFTVKPSEGIEVDYVRSYGAFFPIFALIATYFGYKGVKSDDELIKSADRIR